MLNLLSLCEEGGLRGAPVVVREGEEGVHDLPRAGDRRQPPHEEDALEVQVLSVGLSVLAHQTHTARPHIFTTHTHHICQAGRSQRPQGQRVEQARCPRPNPRQEHVLQREQSVPVFPL